MSYTLTTVTYDNQLHRNDTKTIAEWLSKPKRLRLFYAPDFGHRYRALHMLGRHSEPFPLDLQLLGQLAPRLEVITATVETCDQLTSG